MEDETDLYGPETGLRHASGGSLRRPMNAFLIFCKKHRPIVRNKNPSLDNRAVSRILGEVWAHLPSSEKSEYLNMAKEYRDAFMRANPDYHWHTNKRETLPAFKSPATRPGGIPSTSLGQTVSAGEKIVLGKLADPSNMGGLGMLWMSGGGGGSEMKLSSVSPTATARVVGKPNPESGYKHDPNDERSVRESNLNKIITASNTDGIAHVTAVGSKLTSNKPIVVTSTNAESWLNKLGNGTVIKTVARPSPEALVTSQLSVSTTVVTSAPKPTAVVYRSISSTQKNQLPVNPSAPLNSFTRVHLSSTSVGETRGTIKYISSTKDVLNVANNGNTVKFSEIQAPRFRIIRTPIRQPLPNNPATVTSASGAKQVVNTSKPPLAMPLMVNKIFETVLCKEPSNGSGDESCLAKKLECDETLDDEGSESEPVSAESSAKHSDILDPSLTFSQIQERLIRKAMEHTQFAADVKTQEPPPVVTKTMMQPINRMNGLVNGSLIKTVTQSTKNGNSATTGSVNGQGMPTFKFLKAEVKEPKIKAEEFVKNENPMPQEENTMLKLLENCINTEIKEDKLALEAKHRSTESMDLTCSEEFKDSETDSPPKSEVGWLKSRDKRTSGNRQFGKLRNQIESQLTSHLMASAGVLTTYENQIGKTLHKRMVTTLKDKCKDDNTMFLPCVQNSNSKQELRQVGNGSTQQTVSEPPKYKWENNSLPLKKRSRYFSAQDNTNLTKEQNDQYKQTDNVNLSTGKLYDSAPVSPFRSNGFSRTVENFTTNGKPVARSNTENSSSHTAVQGQPMIFGFQPAEGEESKHTGPTVEETDKAMEDTDSAVRKSKRRNRGQKYRELLSQGLLQTGRHKTDSHDPDSMAGLASVRRRKRQVSESNSFSALNSTKVSPSKPAFTAFDLDAHIAELPSCQIDDSKYSSSAPGINSALKLSTARSARFRSKTAQPVVGRASTQVTNESGGNQGRKSAEPKTTEVDKSTPQQSKNLTIAELRQTQLTSQRSQEQPTSGQAGHVSGSQKRKQRRCPITKLHLLSKSSAASSEDNNSSSRKTGTADSSSSGCDITSVSFDVKGVSLTVSEQAGLNPSFATLLDVAVAETEKLKRQSRGPVSVGCT